MFDAKGNYHQIDTVPYHKIQVGRKFQVPGMSTVYRKVNLAGDFEIILEGAHIREQLHQEQEVFPRG